MAVLSILFVSFIQPFPGSQAAPISSEAEDESKVLPNNRTMIQIIWTCWAVIVASTWVCVHPHVPGHKSKQWSRWGIRGRLFLGALLFPDQSVNRAIREWMGAQSLYLKMIERRKTPEREEGHFRDLTREKVKGRGSEVGEPGQESRPEIATAVTVGTGPVEPSFEDWTVVHANFIQMGGVAFKGSNGGVWFKDFEEWSNDDIGEFFALGLSKEDIQDRSKADALAKTFVIVQCLWFVVQCVGRAAFHLPLIELEVTSLAYIAGNVGMYAFWWNKPLNVACTVTIPSAGPAPLSVEEAPIVSATQRQVALVNALFLGDIGRIVFPSRGPDNRIVPGSPPAARFPVNYFYHYGNFGTFRDNLIDMAPLTVFGALHAVAWNSPFPSRTEQFLWRASSVAPAVLASASLAALIAGRYGRQLEGWDNVPKSIFFFVAPPVLVVCFAARIAFLVLPAFQLRNLPPLAYQTVPWSDFFPHV